MTVLWILRDNYGCFLQFYASVADCLVDQAELWAHGIHTSFRLLEINPPSSTIH